MNNAVRTVIAPYNDVIDNLASKFGILSTLKIVGKSSEVAHH